MDAKYAHIREQCCEANKQLPKLKIVDLTFGNVSMVDRTLGVFGIKPSGVGYDELKPDDIVILDLEGKHIEGSLRPSSDTPTHRRLYLGFGDIGAVVHTHSRNATAFAQARRAIPCMGTTHADYFYGEVPVTREMTAEEIQTEYEWQTGNVIVERFADINPNDINAVLVRGHGPFVWGDTVQKAVENAFALEVIAEMTLKSISLLPEATPIPQALHDKHYLRKHGKGAYYGQGK